MTGMQAIRTALQVAERSTLQLIEDMRDAPLTQPTPRGGNHPLWVLGHLTLVEGSIPQILFGEPNPAQKWWPLFGPGTEVSTNGTAYPPLDEVLQMYRELRARNLQILDELGESGLDRQTVAPIPGLEEVMRTAGDTFLIVALHQMNHRGQVADSRRAAGRKPMFTPGVAT
jgi:uncharacterized damage-inducible protein DinB